jgi:hypothetical protein
MVQFFETPVWQGIIGIATIIGVIATIVALKRRRREPTDEIMGQRRAEVIAEPKSTLLPDANEITRLNIENEFLTQLREQAHSQAIAKYHDAKLSWFAIQVYPFESLSSTVTIYFGFYSQWADRECTIASPEGRQIRHMLPDKPVKDDRKRMVFTESPWNESPHWLQFLNRAYERVGPLSRDFKTYYVLYADAGRELPWYVIFQDGITGREYEFEWGGRGLDAENLKERY